DRAAVRAALGFSPPSFVVGALGRLEPRQRLDLLIEAVSRIVEVQPGLHLLFAGDGRDRERLRACAAEHGVPDRLHFVSGEGSAREALGAMDVLAVPSRSDGHGFAAIEALAAGVPVIAARAGALPEVVEDGVCGVLVPPDDVAEWAVTLDRLALCADDVA